MAQTTFSVCMDEKIKREFDALCADFGMNAATAFNIFAHTVVREKRIPFAIQVSDSVSLDDGMRAFLTLRREAMENGVQNLTLDEINREIQKARNGEVED